LAKIKATVKVHFDGEFVAGHKISARVLSLSLLHIQTAIERAYLDITHKGVWKYARMRNQDYEQTEFFIKKLKRGGIICDLFSKAKDSARVVDRVSRAINAVKLQGKTPLPMFRDQARALKNRVLSRQVIPLTFKDFVENPGEEIIRQYGDRSIGKEIDQVLSNLRREDIGDSKINIALTGTSTQDFEFNKASSERFHSTVARRGVAKAIIYKGKLTALDMATKKGKFDNSETQKTSTLHLDNDADLLKVHPFLISTSEMVFVGAPLIEFGSIEPNSGDVYFICLLEDISPSKAV
jgi:hypothetical protein